MSPRSFELLQTKSSDGILNKEDLRLPSNTYLESICDVVLIVASFSSVMHDALDAKMV